MSEQSIILYHATLLRRCASIRKHGLIPFPVAYDDGYFVQENRRPGLFCLPTTGGQPNGLRMPPPGRSRKTLFAREVNA
jgi:hypothetical protein